MISSDQRLVEYEINPKIMKSWAIDPLNMQTFGSDIEEPRKFDTKTIFSFETAPKNNFFFSPIFIKNLSSFQEYNI